MSSPHWLTGEIIDENTTPWVLGMNKSYFLLGVKAIGIFLLVFIILTLDFLALSVSLQCNRKSQFVISNLCLLFWTYIFINKLLFC